MAAQYLISLQVKYQQDATDVHRSLRWLAPELSHAELTLTEDASGLRTWGGVVDRDTFEWLADAWDLEDGSHAYAFDGTEFDTEGWTPIACVSLSVSECDPVEHQLARTAA